MNVNGVFPGHDLVGEQIDASSHHPSLQEPSCQAQVGKEELEVLS